MARQISRIAEEEQKRKSFTWPKGYKSAVTFSLEENWIAGAGLDVFATEPLPSDSRLWELPNVIITSHIGGQREDYDELATNIFCENLKRHIEGKRLLNIVDTQAGH